MRNTVKPIIGKIISKKDENKTPPNHWNRKKSKILVNEIETNLIGFLTLLASCITTHETDTTRPHLRIAPYMLFVLADIYNTTYSCKMTSAQMSAYINTQIFTHYNNNDTYVDIKGKIRYDAIRPE